MKFNFENLDDQTRKLMSDESEGDLAKGKLYSSKRFNEKGTHLYSQLLKKAISDGDEQTLASELKANDCFAKTEQRKTKTGSTTVKVPENAHQVLSESEFNRFYIRALCLRAIESGRQLKIYRARHSDNPRPESEVMIGKLIDPKKLLADLRTNIGVDTALGLPPGPNSGLSVKLI